MSSVAEITDHQQEAIDRLPEQHKDKVKLPALIDALLAPASDERPGEYLEEVLIQLLVERTIDTAIGAQLDVIGRIVGITRAEIDSAISDDDFRRYVRAKIWAQRSYGIVFDILRVMRLVINDDDATYVLEMQFPAGLIVRIDDVAVVDAVSTIAAQFLRDAAAGGVRVIFESSADVDTEMFTFARFSPLDGLHGSGSGTVTIDDASAFDDTGSIVMDEGLAVEETLAYTSRTGTVFTLSGTTANAHADNSSVTQDGAPGKGFDDEASPGAGGKFASAKEGL